MYRVIFSTVEYLDILFFQFRKNSMFLFSISTVFLILLAGIFPYFLASSFVRALLATGWHIAEVAASQHIINASNAAKIHKYLSREVRQQFWQYAR
jgi:hypothetical protein